MNDSKSAKIIEAATKVFAQKGYQYATITEIASEAGVSTGLIYSYFKNKLDLLLSIISLFWQKINDENDKRLPEAEGPYEKLLVILGILESMLLSKRKALYLAKVLKEALPHIAMIKDKSLQKKRQEIVKSNMKMLDKIDKILEEGQKKKIFQNELNPSVMRQVLFGSIETLIYGLYTEIHSETVIGYNKKDAHDAISGLIKNFICT